MATALLTATAGPGRRPASTGGCPTVSYQPDRLRPLIGASTESKDRSAALRIPRPLGFAFEMGLMMRPTPALPAAASDRGWSRCEPGSRPLGDRTDRPRHFRWPRIGPTCAEVAAVRPARNFGEGDHVRQQPVAASRVRSSSWMTPFCFGDGLRRFVTARRPGYPPPTTIISPSQPRRRQLCGVVRSTPNGRL